MSSQTDLAPSPTTLPGANNTMNDVQPTRFPVVVDPTDLEATINNIKKQHRPSHRTLEDWKDVNVMNQWYAERDNHLLWLEALDCLTAKGQVHPALEKSLPAEIITQIRNNLAYSENKSNTDVLPEGFIPAPHANPSNINDIPLSPSVLETVRGIERRDYNELSTEEFRTRYEYPSIPVIIRNANCGNATEPAWPSQNWTLDWLAQSKYKDAKFRIGDDKNGYAMRVPLQQYFQYLETQDDLSPLYLFEDDFGERPISCEMLQEYTPPRYFSEDLFLLMSEERRPPFRWIIAGPQRSGTKMHIDPLGTSAWNVTLTGIKRWILFSPKIVAQIANSSHLIQPPRERSYEAIEYFTILVPKMRQFIASLPVEQRKEYCMMECLQYPGEAIFVPNGWHHAVMNYTDSIAFTQNWASSRNFLPIWKHMCSRRTYLARRLMDRLQVFFPTVAQQIEDSIQQEYGNKPDDLEMYSPHRSQELRPRRVTTFDNDEEKAQAEKDAQTFLLKLFPDFFDNIDDETRQRAIAVLTQGNEDSSDSDDDSDSDSSDSDDNSD